VTKMIKTATLQGAHVAQRLSERLGIQIDPTKTHTINLEKAIYVAKYKHHQHNTRMVDYVLTIKNTPVVMAIDIDNQRVYSVMTEGKKVDICFNKARGILKRLRKQPQMATA